MHSAITCLLKNKPYLKQTIQSPMQNQLCLKVVLLLNNLDLTTGHTHTRTHARAHSHTHTHTHTHPHTHTHRHPHTHTHTHIHTHTHTHTRSTKFWPQKIWQELIYAVISGRVSYLLGQSSLLKCGSCHTFAICEHFRGCINERYIM